MYTLGPYDISQPVQFNPITSASNVSAQPVIGVLIQNPTAQYLIITSGTTSDFIAPFAPYFLRYSKSGVTSAATVNLSALNPTTGQVPVSVYQLGDTEPPVALTASPTEVVVSSLTAGTVNIAGNVTAVPPVEGLLSQGTLVPGGSTGVINLNNVGSVGIFTFSSGSGSSPAVDTCDLELDWLNTNNLADVLFAENWSQWCSTSTSKRVGTTMIDVIPPMAPFMKLKMGLGGSGQQSVSYKIWAVPLSGSFERPTPGDLLRVDNVTVPHNLGTAAAIFGATVFAPGTPAGFSTGTFHSPGSVDISIFSTDPTTNQMVVLLEEWIGGTTLAWKERGRQLCTTGLPTFGSVTPPWRTSIGRSSHQLQMSNTNGTTDYACFGSVELARD